MQQLARKGAKVYIAGRSEARVAAAIERLRAEGREPGNGALEWVELDLSDPRKAKEGADRFVARETRLDVLGACHSILGSGQGVLTFCAKFTMPQCEYGPGSRACGYREAKC